MDCRCPNCLVAEFMRSFGCPTDVRFWVKLVAEELKETSEAALEGRTQHYLKEVADLVYVLAGYAHSHPEEPLDHIMPGDEADEIEALIEDAAAELEIADTVFTGKQIGLAVQRVHESNMSKLDPETGQPIRHPETGKIMKPSTYVAPDLTDLLTVH